MASTPSPDSSPSGNPPVSSPPPLNSSTVSPPPPTVVQPNQTSDPPVSSTPSPPPPPVPDAPTPSTPSSPPPPPPVTPAPTSPPPSPPKSPPPSPPPSPPAAPPSSPPASPPPPPPAASPPVVNSPPPPKLSPPPPSEGSPPPETSPPPPVTTPPPTQTVPSSPPPPADVPTHSPPPPHSSKKSPPPPTVTPPPSDSQSPPPPPVTAPSSPTLPTPPPSVPPITSPTTPTNSSETETPVSSPLPAFPSEKPTATNGTNKPENATSTSNGGLNTGGAVAIGIIVGFAVLSLLVFAVWFVQKKRKRRSESRDGYVLPSPFASSQNSDSSFLRSHSPPHLAASRSNSDAMYSSEAGGVSNSRTWFTYEELSQATNGFSSQHLLGEGGFGCVYKGVLADGRVVAVKQLKIGGGQGEREFRAEVEIISRVHHRHLVSLVGYCISDHQRLLVYDFVSNDTLHYHLHGDGRPVLDWATRVKVAAGAARGLAYLHEDCHPRIIHRDIKSSNILVNDNFEAQVSDFGLAKLALDSNTHITTRVMGTFGYMAPEYATSGKLTEKSDVYSFGVVLLELITGRKPVDASQPLGDESLVEWARPLLTQSLETENFEELVDPRLEKNYVEVEMFRMIEAAAACIRHSSVKRPRMSQVVRALDSLDEYSDLSNGMKLGHSEIYDSAEQSAQIRMFQRMAFGSQDYSSEYFNRTHSSWRSSRRSDQSFVQP